MATLQSPSRSEAGSEPSLYFNELEPRGMMEAPPKNRTIFETPPSGDDSTEAASQTPETVSSSTKNPIAPWEKAYIAFIRFESTIQCLPYHFDKAKGSLFLAKSKFVLLIWLSRMVGLTFDNIYLLTVSSQVKLGILGEKEVLNFWSHTISRISACFVGWGITMEVMAPPELFNAIVATRLSWKSKNWKITKKNII